jgi:alanyl-tRNA synthetase
MKSSEVRQSFLDYFERHDHKIIPSSSLIPVDDPTLLFTNAGMNQFKLVFTGDEKRPYKRAASSQKCIRAGGKHNDLENVGETPRHHTFFEMLGNFSFGDYFKAEAIEYAWEFMIKVVGLPKDRLWATVFRDDDEAYELWEKIVPELKGRILRFDEKENYWSMGDTGPCGPCAEIHFDRGEDYGNGPNDVVNGETDRFVEIWNLVFMQFDKDADGNVIPLPKPSIDTGAGLERIVCILQDAETNFDTDLFMPIIGALESLCGRKYEAGPSGTSFRVVADHLRALTFAFSDGAVPSNEGRGYVLRRILRRAARHGRLLGIQEPFVYKLTPVVREIMGGAYPELESKAKHVTELIRGEEERFNETLDNGLALFDKVAKKVKSEGSDTIPGNDVFKLCDTYGFPPDLTEVMARENDLKIDMPGFEKYMAEQKRRSREARGSVGFVVSSYKEKSEFAGHSSVKCSEVTVLKVKEREDGRLEVLLKKTPFYGESGGQVGDTGRLTADGLVFEVLDTLKSGEAILHIGKNLQGDIRAFENKKVCADIDVKRRNAIARNHTATHLVHKALREILGEHVEQSGSHVDHERLRFDFTHFKAVTPDELKRIEQRVNESIIANYPVTWKEMSLDDAKAAGAMALFGEKYGERVRMVEIDDYSRELCGGTHVRSTGEIGLFVITQETAVAAGMRRMEAVTGEGAYSLVSDYRDSMQKISTLLKSTQFELTDRVENLVSRVKEQQKEIDKFKQADGDQKIKSNLDNLTQAGECYFMTAEIDGRKEAQQYLDNVKADARKIIVCMKQNSNYFVAVSKTAADSGVSAMSIIKSVNEKLDGKGGGKDTFAQGGSKKSFDLNDLEQILREIVS